MGLGFFSEDGVDIRGCFGENRPTRRKARRVLEDKRSKRWLHTCIRCREWKTESLLHGL